jgi:hypothetical protein
MIDESVVPPTVTLHPVPLGSPLSWNVTAYATGVKGRPYPAFAPETVTDPKPVVSHPDTIPIWKE